MKSWSDISIKKKTNAIILIVCFVSMLISSIGFLVIEVLSYRDILLDDMNTQADIIGVNSSSAIVFNDQQAAGETLSSLSAQSYVLCGIILNKKRQIFASYINDALKIDPTKLYEEAAQIPLNEAHGYNFDIDHIDLFKEIRLDGESIGMIFLQGSLEDIYTRMKKHTVYAGLILLAVTFLAFLLTSKFQKVLTDPIVHLSQTMEKVTAEGSYAIRAHKYNDDELGALITGFNSMLNKIENRDKQLAKNKIELEARVEERTAELKKANRNLEQMIEDLARAKNLAEAASKTKSDFLANMSHELRTPLNHIIGFTELVLDKDFGDLNEVQQEYLNDVLQSSKHLLSLINDILDLSKVESGKLNLELSEIYLNKLIEASINMVKEQSMKRNLALSMDSKELPERINADERKIKQILFNLLSNAVKFTPDGGSVKIYAEKVNGLEEDKKGKPEKGLKNMIKISVSDTGIGIADNDLDRIFNPFEQVETSTSRKYQGTGLGLSLTRRLVELHGGKIWAESQGKDCGSTISFILPA